MAINPMNALRRNREVIYNASQGLLLAGCLAAAVLTSTVADWSPLELVALLLVLGVLGERLELTVGSQSLSAGFVALVFAMTLLGAAPAVAIAIVAIAFDSLSRRPALAVCLSNTATYVAFALLGGILARAVIGNVHDLTDPNVREVTFALVVFGTFVVTNVVNFALIAIQKRVLQD